MRLFVAIICSAFLAGCARGMSSFSSLPPSALPDANGYALLYSFKSGEDGGFPYASLTQLDGTLYGTTYGGGGGDEWGTVFKISTTGEEHVLYRFKAGDDGAHPYARLIAVDGKFYGTTYQGGTDGAGTVFSVSTSGVEHVLYSFKGGNDGQYPYAQLLNVNGTLYGTTEQGGVSPGWGVVFKVSTLGKEEVLYRFKADKDGAHPFFAGLIAQNGLLYGTTYQGGSYGGGTVFSESPSGGDDHVLYSFKSGSDGEYPYAGLIALDGVVYGTTEEGGASSAGTVFKFSL